MANVIDSLLIGLGFQIDSSKLDEFHQKTAEIKASMLKFGAVAAAAAGGVGLLVGSVARSMGDIASFAELNQISAKSVAALGKIASENDGSLEGMKSTIQSLNRVIGEAALGVGRGGVMFQRLGLQAKRADGSTKSVNEVLGDVADKMQRLSRQEQIAMAEKLGIDPQFVKVLEKGSAELARLREEAELLNPFTDADYQLADQVDKLFIKAKATLGVFTKLLGVSLMPVVRDALTAYMEWFKASRKLAQSGLNTVLDTMAFMLARVFRYVVKLVSGLSEAAKWLMNTQWAALAAAAALGLFLSLQAGNMALTLADKIGKISGALLGVAKNMRTVLITTGIGALLLVIGLLLDDWMAFRDGGESVIGDLVKQFPGLLTVINSVEAAFKSVAQFFVAQWKTIGPSVVQLGVAIGGLVAAIAVALWPVVKKVFTGLGYLIALVVPLVIWLAQTIIERITEIDLWLVKAATKIANYLSALFEHLIPVLEGAFELVSQLIGGLVDWFMTSFDNIADAWALVVALFAGDFSGAAKAITRIWDRTVDTLMRSFDRLKEAFNWVADKLGFGDKKITVSGQVAAVAEAQAAQPINQRILAPLTSAITSQPLRTAIAAAPALSVGAPGVAGGGGVSQSFLPNSPLALGGGGVLGKAADISNITNSTLSNPSTTTNVQITAPITVNSTDPARAGQEIRRELDSINKQAIRNGESAVSL